MRSVGMIVVAVLAVLALVLIILKFKDSGSGPGVSAVPLTAPEGSGQGKGQAPANDVVSGADPTAPRAIKKPAVQQAERDVEIQVLDAATKQPLAGVELSINMTGAGNRTDRTETKGKAWLMLPPKDPSYV